MVGVRCTVYLGCLLRFLIALQHVISRAMTKFRAWTYQNAMAYPTLLAFCRLNMPRLNYTSQRARVGGRHVFRQHRLRALEHER